MRNWMERRSQGLGGGVESVEDKVAGGDAEGAEGVVRGWRMELVAAVEGEAEGGRSGGD